MKEIGLFSGLLLLVSGLVFTSGCAVETASKPQAVLPATGSSMTPEWKEYNRQAEAKNAPLLKYVVTAKSITRTSPRQPQEIQDNFTSQDERLYVFSKWVNVQGRPIYKIRIYDPRGILFRERTRAYRHSSGKWIQWTTLYIRGWAAARLPGKWKAEIYMNDVLAKTQEFVIGSESYRYDQKVGKRGSKRIGVYPYFVNADPSTRRHTVRLPLYIGQMLTVDLDDSQVIMPWQLQKEVTRPIVKYKKVRDYFSQELNSPDSELNALIRKHKLDLVIAAKVYDSRRYDVEKEATFYIINAKTKHIKGIKTSFTAIRAFHRGQVRTKFYKDVYDQLLKKGANEFRMPAK